MTTLRFEDAPAGPRHGGLSSRRVLGAVVLFAMILLVCQTGCVEICAALDCSFFDPDGDGSTGGDNGNSPGGGNGPSISATLSLSNPAPAIGEEVHLRCQLTSGEAQGARFNFQPVSTRLAVDVAAGTARFLVQETDAGLEFAFTCSATSNDGETSARSNRVSFIVSPP